MSESKSSKLEELLRAVIESLPDKVSSTKQEIIELIKPALQRCCKEWDLVTREEFDAQSKVLSRTREKLEKLEKKLLNL